LKFAIKIILKLLGFFVGFAVGAIFTEIILHSQNIPKGQLPGLVGWICGAIGWLIVSKFQRK
jgi:hypothetical protein